MESLKFRGAPITILLLLSLSIGCKKHSSDVDFKTEQGYALGTTYNIRYEATNDTMDLKKEIDDIFNRLNKSISTYLPTSDISRINHGDTTVVVDEYFKEVYLKAREVWNKSGGVFDPTVGALVNAWGFGPETALKNISQVQVDSILQFTGFEKVSLTDDNRIVKAHPSVYLDFNALAKGYTIDVLGRLFDERGIENYTIEIGAETLTKGEFARTIKNWMVAIDNPIKKDNQKVLMAKVVLENKAMASSGNYRKFRIDEETGEPYVHTINPKTGQPQKNSILSVSVVANTCMDADAYATALMVMDLDSAKELLKMLNGLEAFIISADKDGDLQEYRTRGFQELLFDPEKDSEN